MISIPRSPIIDPKSGRLNDDWLAGVFNKITDRQFFPISTAGGAVSQPLPDLKKNFRTEVVFVKTTNDANHLTITGGALGNVVLTTQGDIARFMSDGNANWWQV